MGSAEFHHGDRPGPPALRPSIGGLTSTVLILLILTGSFGMWDIFSSRYNEDAPDEAIRLGIAIAVLAAITWGSRHLGFWLLRRASQKRPSDALRFRSPGHGWAKAHRYII